MATLFVRHKVNNYESWKRGYDGFASVRKANGVIGASVYRDPKEPNTVVVIHQFKNMDEAIAMTNSDELKKAMADAGVTGQPEIWFGDEIETTPF